MLDNNKPKVGISQCLLGDNVRYNGGHKLDHYLKKILGEYVDFVPVCPEVEAGLGIPREPMHLFESGKDITIKGEKTGKDYTPVMTPWIKNKVLDIEKMNLCGFILKSKSPSCGIFRTRLYREGKPPSLDSRGLFAKELISSLPDLLVEEEGRLNDPVIRENFIERVYINFRWFDLCSSLTVNKLINFHEKIKYILMSHNSLKVKELGRIVSSSTKNNLEESAVSYYKTLNKTLSEYTNRKKHRNVLEHIMGYFKNNLSKDEKLELHEIIKNYYKGIVPIIVPITLLNHYSNKYKSEYLTTQYYLNPHPLELLLRNNI